MRVYWRSICVGLFSGIGFLAAMAVAAVSAQAQEFGPRFYNSPALAAMKPPFSQAVRVGDILFMSGTIGDRAGHAQTSRPAASRARPNTPWTTSARCSKPTI